MRDWNRQKQNGGEARNKNRQRETRRERERRQAEEHSLFNSLIVYKLLLIASMF